MNERNDNTRTNDDAAAKDRALQVCLAEYGEYVHNIRDRVQIEQSIMNYTVFLTAAMIPASIQIVDHRAFTAFYFMPPIFSVLALLALRQDLMITAIAGHIHSFLAPRLRAFALHQSSFTLEETLLQLRRSAIYIPIGFARYALFGLPAVFSTVAAPYFKRKYHYFWTSGDTWLICTDLLLIIATGCWIAKISTSSFLSLTEIRLKLIKDQ